MAVILVSGAYSVPGVPAFLLAVAAVVVVTALAVYTFGDHPQADRGRVFKIVFGVPLAIAAFAAGIAGAVWWITGSESDADGTMVTESEGEPALSEDSVPAIIKYYRSKRARPSSRVIDRAFSLG